MLNRRILRIKAFQALYASVLTKQSDNPMTLVQTQEFLQSSCESTRDLYVLMLGIISPLTKIASERIDSSLRKINPTEEEKNPNRKFADNALAQLFDSDPDFQKIWKKKKFSWAQNDIFLRQILDSVKEKEWFKEYMNAPESSLKEDCRLFIKIFEEEFSENESLYEILEEMSIYWTYDIAYSLTWCCNTLKSIAAGHRWSLPPLYMSDIIASDPKQGKAVDSDKIFVSRILMNAFTCYDKYADLAASLVVGRDKDRLVATDLCIIVCCLAEVVHIPEIPVSVSMNEWVEISKFFGTPKSSQFVNGMIDRIVKQFISDGTITKDIK